jgi:hypothetical protein
MKVQRGDVVIIDHPFSDATLRKDFEKCRAAFADQRKGVNADT